MVLARPLPPIARRLGVEWVSQQPLASVVCRRQQRWVYTYLEAYLMYLYLYLYLVRVYHSCTCAFDGIPTTFCSVLSFFSILTKDFVNMCDTKTRKPSASNEGFGLQIQIWLISKKITNYMISRRRKRNATVRGQIPVQNIMQRQEERGEGRRKKNWLDMTRFFFSILTQIRTHTWGLDRQTTTALA